VITGKRGAMGDFNYDGVVDIDDLAEWRQAYRVVTAMSGTPSFVASADANEDGRVDGGDFLTWQRSLAAPATQSVPEPKAQILLVAITIAWRRRSGIRTVT